MEVSKMVLESAKPRLKKLTKTADRLNKASDRYTEELKTIEAELNALNLGLECVLPIAIQESPRQTQFNDQFEPVGEYQISHFLGYGKHRADWGFLVFEYRECLDGDKVYRDILCLTTLLLYSSRELRLASADHLLNLLDLLNEKAEEKSSSLEKVSDTRKS